MEQETRKIQTSLLEHGTDTGPPLLKERDGVDPVRQSSITITTTRDPLLPEPHKSGKDMDIADGLRSSIISSTTSSTHPNKSSRAWNAATLILAGPSAGTYTFRRKRVILAVVSLTGVLGPLMGTIFSPALPDVERDLNTTDVLANLALTLSQVGMAVSPLFWAPLSDTAGRRPILMISQVVNIGGSIMAIFSPNIAVFLSARLISAVGSGAGMVVGAAVVSDVFPTEERGRASGPKSTPAAETINAKSNHKPSAFRNLITAFAAQRHVFVVGPTLLQGAVFGSYYAFPGSLPRDWKIIYGFSTFYVGLVVATIGIGMVTGALFGGWYADRQVRVWTRRRKVWVPEDRLRSMWVGAVAVPLGLVLYGVGIQYAIPWEILIAALLMVGYGNMVISTCSSAYYMDIFGRSFASINAVATFIRLIWSACVAVLVVPGVDGMTHAGFFGFLAATCVVGAVVVMAVIGRGTVWRCKRDP
ncbi:hypothetical protein HDU93_000733 [Gonapodya sp. JEL0774]|nr:hypothetical protein HDU93_000733 [Gonapodya sp. JEL0774]